MSSSNQDTPPPYTYKTVDRAPESATVSYDGGTTWEPIPPSLLEGFDQNFQKHTHLSYQPGLNPSPEDIKADLGAVRKAIEAYREQTGREIKTLEMTEIAPSTALTLSRSEKQNIVWNGNRAYRVGVIEAFDRGGNVVGERARQDIKEAPHRNLNIRDDRSRGRC